MTPRPQDRPLRRWWSTVLALTLVGLLVAEVAVRLASDRLGEPLVWYSRSAQSKADALERRPADAEVAFMGSSAVMASLDPAVFSDADRCGRRAYNAGIAGAVPSVSDDWLSRVIEPAVGPKLVVLGISPRDLSTSASSAGDAYFGAVAIRDDLGARADRWVSSWSALVRYRTTLRSPRILKGRIDELRGAPGDGWTFNSAGFEPRSGDDPPNTAVQNNDPGLALDRDQVTALDDLVVFLDNEGITPVLALMGTSEGWSSTPRGARLADDTEEALADISERRDTLLVDLSSVSDPTSFVDLVHTNRTGSEQETRLLADQLGETCP